MIKNFAPVRYETMIMGGGMDQITPNLSVSPGVVRRAANFECELTGGYTRIEGYERFDGRPSPSRSTIQILEVDDATPFAVGNTVTSVTASARVMVIDEQSIIVSRATGDFSAGQSLTGPGGSANIVKHSLSAINGLKDAQYRFEVSQNYRADIGKVPGEGRILGVASLAGVVYAWRNNIGSTQADMWRSSSTGWQQVTLHEEVYFTNATGLIQEGSTLTQGGVTATILRVMVRTGTIASSTNAGTMVISSRLGGSFSSGFASTGSGALTLSGPEFQIKLSPGGNFSAVVGNFGGGSENRRLYGTDGVNRAWEFDGTVFAPITTSMTPDVPHIAVVHRQHLFLAFGHSVQFSGVGDPFAWTPVQGAGEIAMNDRVTVMSQLSGDQTNGALGIFTPAETSILYGSSSANFQLSSFNTGTGAVANTAQNLEQNYFLTDQGVVALATSLNFGNFLPSTLTTGMTPFIRQHYSKASSSGISRRKAQYRVFFSDGYGVYVTVRNGKFIGAMPVQFPDAVLCMCEGERPDGTKTSYFGSTSGYVFEIDAGTSFDGEVIDANFTLPFNPVRSPRILKHFRKASVEVYGNAYSEFYVGYDLGYRSVNVEQGTDVGMSDMRSTYWDETLWDNFVWDGSEVLPTEIGLLGSAENIAMRIGLSSEIFRPFTVNSITLHFTPRRGVR